MPEVNFGTVKLATLANFCPLKLFLTSVSAGSPGLFRHTWASDDGSSSRLQCIHVGVKKCGESVKFAAERSEGKCCCPDCRWGGWTYGAFKCCRKYKDVESAHVSDPLYDEFCINTSYKGKYVV